MAYMDNRPDDQPEVPPATESAPADVPEPEAEGVAPEPKSTASATGADGDGEQLLSDEQVEALKADPEAYKRYQGMNRAFTQKTQRIAKEREELSVWKDLIDAYQVNPDATIEALARNAGYTISKSDAPTEKEPADLQEEVRAIFTEALGPEYEDLADRLAPAITRAAEKVAERKAAPLIAAHQQQLQTQALNEANAEMETFGKAHPDWKDFEVEMNKLGAMLTPKPGMNPQQFLTMLYLTAKGDKAIAEATGKALRKMQASAEGAARDTGSVGADKVSVTPAKPLTFREAAALAKRGVRIE